MAVIYAVKNKPFAAAVAENRCIYRIVTSASYRYTQPAHQVTTYLRLVPRESRGLQHLLHQEIQVAPLPYATPEYHDDWGNRVIEARIESVREHLTFVIDLTVSTACRYDDNGRALPTPIPPLDSSDAERYSVITRRTTPSLDMERFARDLCQERDPGADPMAFLTLLRARVHARMTFKAGSTNVGTTAAEAWEAKTGVCQDYTHIALTLCRLTGFPARYVSGFVPGEGVMHAWPEVMVLGIPGEKPAWYALDPTYDKWVDERYVSVAVGRDYADGTPTSGSYYGGASALRYGARMVAERKEMVLL